MVNGAQGKILKSCRVRDLDWTLLSVKLIRSMLTDTYTVTNTQRQSHTHTHTHTWVSTLVVWLTHHNYKMETT